VMLLAHLAVAQDIQVVIPLSCVPRSCRGVRVEATVHVNTPLTRIRVYFHSEADPRDYFLDMQQTAGKPDSYFAVLPVVADKIMKVSYFISATDSAGKDYMTDPLTLPVRQDCATHDVNMARDVRDQHDGYAKNLIIGMTDDSQNAEPAGFLCYGVVSEITASGELKPNDSCRMKRKIDPCGLLIPPVAIVAGGAAAVVGIAVLDRHHPKPPRPISNARP